MAIGIIRSIDPEKSIVEISTQADDGTFYKNAFKYDYSKKFTKKGGDEGGPAFGWIIDNNGEMKVKVGDQGEFFYTRGENNETSILHSFKKISETSPPPRPPQPNPAQTVINQNAAKANGEKETALIIAATFLSGKGYTDWQEFKSMLGTVLPAVEQDIRAMLR